MGGRTGQDEAADSGPPDIMRSARPTAPATAKPFVVRHDTTATTATTVATTTATTATDAGVTARFRDAADAAAAAPVGTVPESQQLLLYALYKQATVGDCTLPRPGMVHFTARAKWCGAPAWPPRPRLRR